MRFDAGMAHQERAIVSLDIAEKKVEGLVVEIRSLSPRVRPFNRSGSVIGPFARAAQQH
jgi:hypothetical protein